METPILTSHSTLYMYVCYKSLQSCWILCDPMDCIPPGSSVHGILQARILEWVACPPPGNLPDQGIELESLMSPALAGRFFTTSATWEAWECPPFYSVHLSPKLSPYGTHCLYHSSSLHYISTSKCAFFILSSQDRR